MKLEFHNFCWGEYFTELTLSILFPSLLAAQNLPAWPFKKDSVLIIHTTKDDWLKMENESVFTSIQSHIQIKPHFFCPEELKATKQSRKNMFRLLGQRTSEVLANAVKNKVGCIMLGSDLICSNGMLFELAKYISAGKELVLTSCPFVQSEKIISALESFRQNNTLSIEPDECVDLFIQYMHPINQTLFLNAQQLNKWTSQVYVWQDNQIKQRSFHLHPIYMYNPPQFIHEINDTPDTIDGHYLQQYQTRKEKVVIIKDQSMVGLTTKNFEDYLNIQYLDEYQPSLESRLIWIDTFGKEWCSPIHRWFFTHLISWQGSGQFKPENISHNWPLQDIDRYYDLWLIEELYEQHCFEKIVQLYVKHKLQLPISTCFLHSYFYLLIALLKEKKSLDNFLTVVSQKTAEFRQTNQLCEHFISKKTQKLLDYQSTFTEEWVNHPFVVCFIHDSFEMPPIAKQTAMIIITDSNNETIVGNISDYSEQYNEKEIIVFDQQELTLEELFVFVNLALEIY